jgi:hypothetical protein
MTFLGFMAGLATLLAGGIGATLLVFRGSARLNAAEGAALSWLFGTGLVSLGLWLGGLVLSGVTLQIAVAAALLAFAAAGVISVRRARTRIAIPKPRNVFEWILSAVIAIEIALMIYAAAGHGLGWDGLFNWEVKARYAFLNGGVIPPAYFSSETRAFSHPAYPPLIPLTELWFYLAVGEANQFWIKFIFPLFYAAGAILLATIATRLTQQRWAGLLSAALMFFVPFLTNAPGTASSGYVDVPLGAIYLATIGYLILFAITGGSVALRLYAVSLALLPCTKREGAILWLVAATCGALVIWRRERNWRPLLWLLPGALFFIAWRIFLHILHTNEAHDFAPTFALLQMNAARIGRITLMVTAELLDIRHWSLFWPAVAGAVVYLASRRRDHVVLLLLAGALVAPLMLYAAMFVFSTERDWMAHMEASVRLLLHVMPIGWLAIACAIAWPPAITTTSAAV